MPIDNARIFDLMDEQFKSEGRYNVVKGIEGDKKKAAESIGIEKATGADPQRVYGDYDSFTKRRKSEIAQTLVEDDKWLLEYAKKPLATTVSNDDWGNLSTYTDAARKLMDHIEVNPIIKLYKDAKYAADFIKPTDSSYFMKGLVTTLGKENPDLAAEFVEGMSYHMPEMFRPAMFTGAKAIRDFAATITPEGYEKSDKDMWSVRNSGDAYAWGMESFGSVIGSMVPTFVGAGVGAGIGFATPIPGGALAGAAIGGGSVAYGMGYAEVYKALKTEGIDPALASKYATVAGAAIAAFDIASLGALTGKIPLQAVKKEITGHVAKRIAKAIAEGATIEGVTESIQEIIKDATVSWAADKQFGTTEQIKGWIESGVVGAMGGGAFGVLGTQRRTLNDDLIDIKKTADAATKLVETAEPWIKAGQKPPIGIDPVIDHFLMLDSQERLDILDAVIENGDKTETKELSPELWQDLQKLIYEKKQIEIKWDAVKAMYGDKLPEADDKLLGFVPNIQQQFANSNLTGESIKINIADWVGKVDPEVNKMLHDDLSFSDGMTINEAKTKPKLEDVSEIHEKEVPGLSDELDKPYSLKKLEDNRYHVLDEAGEIAAGVKVVENENGKNLHVNFETGQIDVAGVRTLLKQLKEEYPDAETITTPKVAGVESLRRALQGSNITVGLPFRVKETTVQIVRRSAGLEPLFDLPREGPRSVTVVRNKGQGLYPGDVNFTLTDEVGNPIGEIEGALRQKGKDLYIDWIGNLLDQKEMGRDLLNKLGPRLVRGILRQIKQQFPGLNTITGFRVTGGREKSGRGGEVIQVNLRRLEEEMQEAPAGWESVEAGTELQNFHDLIQGAIEIDTGVHVWAQKEWTPEQLKLEDKITKLLNKIIPDAQHRGVEKIRIEDQGRLKRARGLFQMFTDREPVILWALEGKDPIGTARHEAVHFLRTYGYITAEEWETLTQHVKDNNLIEKHGIKGRYGHLSEEVQIEEAIADEFKFWRRDPKAHIGQKIFEKIQKVLDAIKNAYHEFLGREPTVEDIFTQMEQGKIGRRAPGAILQEKAFPVERKAEIEPLVPQLGQEQVPMMEPGALMDKARYAKYHRHMNEQQNEDAQKELKDAEAEVKRKEKPEWKAKEAEMKIEVTKEISNRPDWKVSQFFRNGMFFGMDSKYRPKIDPKFLTPEQAAGLPNGFMQKGGMDPDKLAGSFGYSSGEAMVNRMVEFERVKGKLGPKEFFDEMVKQETARRMELKYGKMAEEILKEAMDHVIGTTQMDLLHEETMALALRAGQAFTLTKEDFRDQAKLRFAGETASQISMRGYFREMYRAGKAAELAFLNGDYVTAFQQKQQQVHLFTLAEMAKKFEKTERQLDEIVKRYNKRDHDVTKIPPEFVEWIHAVLFQIGRPPKRLPEDLARLIQTRDSKTLEDFVDDKNYIISGNEQYETEVNPKLVVWDKLMERDENGVPTFNKAFDELTVREVQLINISLQSLNKIGRDEGKYNTAYESRVKKDLIGQMKNQLARLGEKTEPGAIRSSLQMVHGGLVQLEAMFDRWDRGNRRGIFTRMFSFPLARASDNFSTMQREFARRIIDIDKKYGMTWAEKRRLIDNDVFYDPTWMELDENKKLIDNGKWLQMTREHIRGVLLNWGNPSNRQRLAEGYYTTVDEIQTWLDKVATEKDYQWAREIGRIYKDIQKESDEMTHRMSGTLVEMLPLPKHQTPFGEYEGWYYPIIYDWSKGGGPRLKEERPPPTVQLTYTGWERKRTGSAGPLDLSLGEMGNFISRRLKDNAFRETLHNIHKIWFDKEFQKYVNRYHGEYANKMFKQAYQDFAGHTGITSGVSNAGNKFAEMIRQNTIGALIGWNPGTVAKHGVSALLQSWKEAGILKEDFYKAMVTMSTPGLRGPAVKFMMEGGKVGDIDFKGSGTLNRRHQHYQETIGGASDVQLKVPTWREFSLQKGSSWVAWSDMYSSQILWKAKYDRIMDELNGSMSIEEAHVQAVDQADYAVRRTHGSTAITSRPEFMRSQNAMTRYLTSLYGFFNHVYNRFYRMTWMAKDLYTDKDITWGEFAKGHVDLTGDFMMYIVGPALIEAVVVEGLMSADWDDMGLGDLLQKGMTHTVSASVPIVREVVHAYLTGHDPAAGLLGTSMKGFTDLARDFSKEEMDNGKAIQHGLTLLAIASGLGSSQIGKWARFLHDLQTGEQAPAEFEEYYRAFRSGSMEYRKGH